MKKILILLLLIIINLNALENNMTSSNNIIGQKYIDFISQKPTDNADINWSLLFSTNVKKVVNSKAICSNRNQLIKQMIEIENTFGVTKINLLEIVIGMDNRINVIRFEVTFKDNTTETIIAILKSNENGLIEEINEVFGQKEAYEMASLI